jgi:membrane-bound lytic murein transglycosylase B
MFTFITRRAQSSKRLVRSETQLVCSKSARASSAHAKSAVSIFIVSISIFSIVFGLVFGFAPTPSVDAKDRPALPKNTDWIIDDADPAALGAAFAAPRSPSNAEAHQRAVHAIAVDPSLRDATLAGIRDRARRALVVRELDSAKQLRLLTKPQANLPKWRIVAPPPLTELRSAYDAAEAESGIEWQYLAAVNFVETKMGRIRGVSTAGAQGPMQFLPATWKRYGNGGDIDNAKDAIAAAGRFLKAKGGPANMRKALFRYNNSNYYVNAVMAYAQNMKDDSELLADYYAWQVIYRWAPGDVVLREGYEAK